MNRETRRLRIGVLGCGAVAQIAHLDACRKAHNAELYAICDVAEDLLAKMSVVHEPRVVYRDYEDMLADPRVEAVIIAVADQFHVPLAYQAVDAGKHLFVEKPLGVNVEECEDLLNRIQNTGLVLQIGHNRRFDPAIAYGRSFIKEELGHIVALKSWYYDSTDRYTMTDNLHPIPVTSKCVKRPEGNPKADRYQYFILGHGSHLVDTARFLGGEIVSVRARFLERFGTYCWFVSVDFANGSLGHFELIIAIRGDFEEGFRVLGEHGSVRGRMFLPWYHKSGHVECFSVKDGLFRRPLGADAYTYKLQIEGFADTILNGAPMHGAGIEDGVAAMRAMVAIARSVKTGESVRLADVTGAV
jgi:predicted dehydrogenase